MNLASEPWRPACGRRLERRHSVCRRTRQAQSLTDVDILNFALNLEYLEAEFYTVATTGRRIEDLGIGVSGVGTLGGTVGGSVVAMDNRVMQVARDIANEEQMHVKLLRTALGSAAVAKPAINLAALGIGFANVTEFLTLARAFEDVGVTAYNGAAPLISQPRHPGVGRGHCARPRHSTRACCVTWSTTAVSSYRSWTTSMCHRSRRLTGACSTCKTKD